MRKSSYSLGAMGALYGGCILPQGLCDASSDTDNQIVLQRTLTANYVCIIAQAEGVRGQASQIRDQLYLQLLRDPPGTLCSAKKAHT